MAESPQGIDHFVAVMPHPGRRDANHNRHHDHLVDRGGLGGWSSPASPPCLAGHTLNPVRGLFHQNQPLFCWVANTTQRAQKI